ncbi:MAG TPA: histidine kinase dimerization/phospho-acceptor domain-containing protein [Steroidobacteraceae bacterium]|nr:histidine kinase dimerization/phospho-acceptor domain-containing protein [Steroidobacteraceae bacterium]
MTTLETLAHELRQPLSAILSNAQAAQRLLAAGGRAAGEVREILEDIVACDKRAAALLRHLEEALRASTRAGEQPESSLLRRAQGEQV